MFVIINCLAILFLLQYAKDPFGYMKFDLNIFSHQNGRSPSLEIVETRRMGISSRRITARNVFIILFAIVVMAETVAWNFIILKIILHPMPGYQIHTINDLISHNFRLSGGPFSNLSIWNSSKVNKSNDNFIELAKL